MPERRVKKASWDFLTSRSGLISAIQLSRSCLLDFGKEKACHFLNLPPRLHRAGRPSLLHILVSARWQRSTVDSKNNNNTTPTPISSDTTVELHRTHEKYFNLLISFSLFQVFDCLDRLPLVDIISLSRTVGS
jgi:hypothetical protein